jgi:hypothetical protein
LIAEVFKLFEIESEDVKKNHRLRAYNVHNRIMMETYSKSESKSLQEMNIYPMRTLILEQKENDAVFEEYDPQSMVVKINLWRANIESLSEEILKP